MAKENIFKRFPWLYHLLLMLGISLVILVIVFMVIKKYARQGEEYELPDVVGTNIADLRADNPIGLDVVILDSVFRPGVEGGHAGSKGRNSRQAWQKALCHHHCIHCRGLGTARTGRSHCPPGCERVA